MAIIPAVAFALTHVTNIVSMSFPDVLKQALLTFFMGVFLGILNKLKKGFGIGIYSIILTHTIIWIETGPTDIMIWFLYLIGLFYLIISFKKNRVK